MNGSEKLIESLIQQLQAQTQINLEQATQLSQMARQISEQTSQLSKVTEQNQKLVEEVAYLNEQVGFLRKKLFGTSSEKTKNLPPEVVIPELFLESGQSNKKASPKKGRKPKEKGRKSKIMEELESEDLILELDEKDRVCDTCEKPMKNLGKKLLYEYIKFVPAKLIKVRVFQSSYYCACGDRYLEPKKIKSAPVPQKPIPNSVASPSLLAEVIHQKFSLCIPLYRQEKEWELHGLQISRRTLTNWVINGAENILSLLTKRLFFHMMEQDIVQGDETTYNINRDEDGNKAKHKGYMWLLRTAKDSSKPVVYYQPDMSRKKEVAEELLKDYNGYFQSDGYGAYKGYDEIINVGCLSHLRRYFFEAVEVKGKGEAVKGLAYCNWLFDLERDFEGLSPEERFSRRLKESLQSSRTSINGSTPLERS